MLHAHTCFSSDGELVPATVGRLARERGFAAVLVTDHFESLDRDAFESLVEECRRVESCLVVPGYERSFDGFHLLALGVDRWIDDADPRAWADRVREAGGLVAIAHPGRYHHRIPDALLEACDAVEVWNSKPPYDGPTGPDPRAYDLLGPSRLPLCGQDLHGTRHLCSVAVELPGACGSGREIVAALRRGHYRMTNGRARFGRELTPSSRRALTAFHRLRRGLVDLVFRGRIGLRRAAAARRLSETVLLLLLAAGIASPSRGDGEPAGEIRWWTTHSLEKIRPDDRPRPPAAIELLAARNEFEPFQLVLRADGRRVDDVDVEVSDLTGRSGSRIASANATIYLERYLAVRTPSSTEGGAGEWPDALLPRVDTYAGERRRAFPATLEPGRNQPVWIDLYVPKSTSPGDYRGEAVVTVGGERRIAAPIVLRVLPFELPSTSTLATSYGLNGVGALEQHRGSYTSDQDLFEITRVYTAALLRHRLSAHGASFAPPQWKASRKKVMLEWGSYDREVADFLDGTVFGADQPLPGARATSIDVRTPPGLPDDESRVLYWREWARHFRERGWLDRLFLYVWDEPARDQHYGKVLALGRQAREAAPELAVLLTEQLAPSLSEVVDVWVTLVNCIERRPPFDYGCEETVPRSGYDAVEREGRRLWWYQSCASHGCGIVGEEAFTGWPSLVVDVDPVANRVMPWLAFAYGIDGELYYNTTEAYANDGSPWDSLLAHGGNGDGTLFYPGTPERVGGSTHIPIESLRLKLVREGLEDYEYLALAASRLGADAAKREVARFVESVYRWDRDPEALYGARRKLAELLSADRSSDLGATR
jgi:hypothetical protein